MSYLKRVSFVLLLVVSVAPANPEVRSTDISAETLSELLHETHEGVEAQKPSDKFWQTFASKVNPRRFVQGAIRQYLLHRTTSETHAMNVVFMLGVSHATETMSGPVYFLYGWINGVSWEVLLPTGSALLTQMLPGVDLMCMVLVGTYAGSPDFRDLITTARQYTVRGAKATGRFFGISHFLKHLVKKGTPTERVKAALESWNGIIRTNEKQNLEVESRTDAGEFLFRLYFKSEENGALVLERAVLNKEADPALIRSRLKPLGWNIRTALAEVVKTIQSGSAADLAYAPFIESVEYWDPLPQRVHLHEGEAHSHSGEHVHSHTEGGLEKHPLVEGDATTQSGEVRIDFVNPMVQVRGKRRYHWGNAIMALPGISLNVLGNVRILALESPILFVHAAVATPGLVVRMVRASPYATFRLGRMGYQIVFNTGRAVGYLARKGAEVGVHCLVALKRII